MDLPKNIVQIGTPDKLHKIFVEDYVISYIKQINRTLKGSQVGLAFYGKKVVEGVVRYYFLYGAAIIDGLEGRGQYLSELERESIEEKQKEFFEAYEFLAWCTLNGEMPDGFYLLEQGKGLQIDGYACFFEKNESMLNFMVTEGNRRREMQQRDNGNVHTLSAYGQDNAGAMRGETKQIQAEQDTVSYMQESVSHMQESEWGRLTDQGNIDHRMEERTRKLESIRNSQSASRDRMVLHGASARGRAEMQENRSSAPGGWRNVLAGIVVVLCVLGIIMLGDEEKMQELQVVARQVMESLNEQKLPDQGEPEEQQKTEHTQPPISQEQTESRSESENGQETESQQEAEDKQAAESQPGTENQTTTGNEQNAENQSSTGNGQSVENQSGVGNGQNTENQQETGNGQNTENQSGVGNGQNAESQPESESGSELEQGTDAAASSQVKTVTYAIQKGDTLLNICRQRYGSDSRLQEICALNNIENADDIKIGQIILLPE